MLLRAVGGRFQVQSRFNLSQCAHLGRLSLHRTLRLRQALQPFLERAGRGATAVCSGMGAGVAECGSDMGLMLAPRAETIRALATRNLVSDEIACIHKRIKRSSSCKERLEDRHALAWDGCGRLQGRVLRGAASESGKTRHAIHRHAPSLLHAMPSNSYRVWIHSKAQECMSDNLGIARVAPCLTSALRNLCTSRQHTLCDTQAIEIQYVARHPSIGTPANRSEIVVKLR